MVIGPRTTIDRAAMVTGRPTTTGRADGDRPHDRRAEMVTAVRTTTARAGMVIGPSYGDRPAPGW